MSFDFRCDLLCSLNVSEHALPVPVIHDLLITGERRLEHAQGPPSLWGRGISSPA
jgi:hypothetical protein